MQPSEILSLAERLIPVYNAKDFEYVLSQLTTGESPSVKLLVKMELKRIMAPCSKSIDLRGRVQGECREYELNDKIHWLDDVAFNAYHKSIKRYGSYTEGVWETLINTRNNFRVMHQNEVKTKQIKLTNPNSPYEAEVITLGYEFKRQENRLKVVSQVNITLPRNQKIHGLSIDLSCSGAKFKVPRAFKYNLGDVIEVNFVALAKKSNIEGINNTFEYRIVGIEEASDNDSIKYLRALRLTDTQVIAQAIEEALTTNIKKTRHDNQDKILQTRSRSYEHIYLKHTCNLPLFFSGNEFKFALLTDNNQSIWQYWHDERNQQSLGSLFTPQRINNLTRQGMKEGSSVIYSFTHEHQDKTLFYSMMLPEASREQRQLFWHIGAKRSSWRAFRLSIFELSPKETESLAKHSVDLANNADNLTHCGILQEISTEQSAQDYLLTEKPRIASSELNKFRHTRQIIGQPQGLYFDAQTRRKEPRYQFSSPLVITTSKSQQSTGTTIDLSKRGLYLSLDNPLTLKNGDVVDINFKELQNYNNKLPLHNVPYEVIRISPDGKQVQLVIEYSSEVQKITAFFQALIEHNQEKLLEKEEQLPNYELLEILHHLLLARVTSAPIFIDKFENSIRTKAIGINPPLRKHLMLLSKLGHEQRLSLEPIFKGRSNTLLAAPMKRIEGAEPQHHEIYLAAVKNGDTIKSIHTYLSSDFKQVSDRIRFIKKAKQLGEIHVLRISTAPIFNPLTSLLQADINELTQISMYQAGKLENEILAMIGYSEIDNITEEVLIRLELT
ncbi:pilus assembly protein PilZ [Vibrio sp. 10N.286.49.B3]|uniref:PilZ domain-containing protein n=1 Tax=Vibrio sp. 10N.286.49.B3 TaxID=1880855 RepID=UPI000C819F4A|nr:PilZ domain-containing protein [Vibrio sp. 10N.286.49.B3]PMH41174.1 pilus assembly protein PilZ [Vibrio sp. 10N.286.49.B3]